MLLINSPSNNLASNPHADPQLIEGYRVALGPTEVLPPLLGNRHHCRSRREARLFFSGLSVATADLRVLQEFFANDGKGSF